MNYYYKLRHVKCTAHTLAYTIQKIRFCKIVLIVLKSLKIYLKIKYILKYNLLM